MIAKRVHRVRGGSFKRLAGYIAKREAIKWQRTADYILDTLGKGERASDIRITNCQADELEAALAEITATQQRNRRARGERTYHLVISFPAGERPSLDQLRDIEDELCGAIGLDAHQRLSAIHNDTANLHIHVAINQVHPQTLCLIEPWYDKAKLMAACERLEIRHDLQRTCHGNGKKRVRGRAGDMEAQSGEQSLTGWIKREVLPSLTKLLDGDGDWPALHKALADHRLTIRRRGAGLVIATVDGKLTVKSSAIDRRLSLQALTNRWGTFQPGAFIETLPASNAGYRKKPLTGNPAIQALYTEYQRQRPERMASRTEALRRLHEENAVHREELTRWSRETAAQIWRQTGLASHERRLALGRHRIEADRLFEELREQSRRDLRSLCARFSGLTWQSFLHEAAEAGNPDARDALYRREKRFIRAIAVIQPGSDWQNSQIAQKQFRPRMIENWTTYRTRDGGRIIDRGEVIALPGDTREAILLSFAILSVRQAGATILLEGDEDFIAKAIRIAAEEKPEVRFANPAHERLRQRLSPTEPKQAPARRRVS